MIFPKNRNVACSINKYCTKSDSRQQLAKKFHSTTICEKIICTIICTRIRTLKMLSVDCGPILLQLFSWESHETSTIPPSRIFPEGHCMICSCFLWQGWGNLFTNSKFGGKSITGSCACFKRCVAFHNVGFMDFRILGF